MKGKTACCLVRDSWSEKKIITKEYRKPNCWDIKRRTTNCRPSNSLRCIDQSTVDKGEFNRRQPQFYRKNAGTANGANNFT